MGDVVNLRLVRKRRNRAEAETLAEANRRKHGRTGAEKAHAKAETKRSDRQLDAHRLQRPDEPRE